MQEKKVDYDKTSIFIDNLLSILILLFRSDQNKLNFMGKIMFRKFRIRKKTCDELVLEFSWVQSIMTDLILLVQ